MTASRLWNRREFDVTPAGYFTVLKPKRWFSAVRLSGTFRGLLNGPLTPRWLEKPAGALGDEQNRTRSQQPAASLRIVQPAEGDRSLVRLAFIVLGAAAITCGLLRWICQP